MRNRTSGFTLIEVLVVLVVGATFFVFGVARYRDFASRQFIINARRQLVSDLRIAQKDAISGRKPQNVTPSCQGELLGYEFEFTNLNSGPSNTQAEYTISVSCDVSGVAVLRTQTIPSIRVQLSSGSANPILFEPLTQGTNLSADLTIQLVDALNPTYTQTLRVDRNGEVNVE